MPIVLPRVCVCVCFSVMHDEWMDGDELPSSLCVCDETEEEVALR